MEEENSSKRRAQQGQWATPPLPFFPSSTAPNTTNPPQQLPPQQPQQTQTQQAPMPAAPSMYHPHPPPPPPPEGGGGGNTNDEYAKALQEAYRRGAEAAAALSRQQLTGVSTTVSCPNLSNMQQQQQQQNVQPTGGGEEPDPQLVQQAENAARNTAYPELPPPQPQQQQPVVANQLAAAPSTATNTTTMMGVPTPLPHLTTIPLQTPPPPPTTTTLPQPSPYTTATTPAPTVQPQPPPPTVVGAPPPPPNQQQPQQQQPRSISMPDITSYAARASAEEEKRKKRLARNRASARLRRLRKKNLVDSYEGEVGILETSLTKLRQHKWGQLPPPNGEQQQHEALLEALSMERGQQCIAPDKREELIYSILDQQREQVQNIMECQLEGLALRWLSMHGDEGGPKIKQEDSVNVAPSAEKKHDDNVNMTSAVTPQEREEAEAEAKQLADELSSLLNLTPAQKVELQKATSDIEEEMRTTATIDSCLGLLRSNSWLMNKGVEEVTDQFSSILNSGQMSKFLLWTDHNAESIDSLDFVHALPAGNGSGGNGGGMVEQGPLFVFGMDEGGVGQMDESEDGPSGTKGFTQ